MTRTSRLRFPLLLVLFALLATLLVVGAPWVGPHSAGAASGGEPEMALSLVSGGVCDPDPSECSVQEGASFVVSVDAVSIPDDGYTGAQGFLDYGNDLGNELDGGRIKKGNLIWPDCDEGVYITNNTDEDSDSTLDAYTALCLTGPIAPRPVSLYTGSLFTVTLTCASPGEYVIDLVSYPDQTGGAAYLLADETTVPAKVSPLIIQCGAAPELAWTVQIEPAEPTVGDSVQVTAFASNVGGGTAGIPKYTLKVESEESFPVLSLESPSSVSFNQLGVPATWKLSAVQVGQATLQVNVNYEKEVCQAGDCFFIFTEESSPVTPVKVAEPDSVGGVASDRELPLLPLEAAGSSHEPSPGLGLIVGVIALGAIALIGSAQYARKRQSH